MRGQCCLALVYKNAPATSEAQGGHSKCAVERRKKEDEVARSVVFSQDYVAATGWWLNVLHTLDELYQCFCFANQLNKLKMQCLRSLYLRKCSLIEAGQLKISKDQVPFFQY